MKSLTVDLVGLSGAGLVVYGASMIHVPSAVIVAGLMMIVIAIKGAR